MGNAVDLKICSEWSVVELKHQTLFFSILDSVG